MTFEAVPCLLMRGGTSKGAYFLADDLPADPAARDDLLLRIMGSPDPRQIDGLGGAHPLTSKVAVVSPSPDPDADVDYLFLQVAVDKPEVTDRQNCGNILAGIGPFAVERGLVPAGEERTSVRIRMLNTGDHATATFPTPGGRVDYTGDAEISGVPGGAAAVLIEFPPGTGPLLPTGNVRDEIHGVPVTCVDNGMPTVLVEAAALKVTGHESPAELEADEELADRLREVRLAAGELMGLGDVSETTVPKVTLLAAPRDGGAVCTRTFIPVRCHPSIGVLGAASVAAGLRIEGGVGANLAELPADSDRLRIEHPSGFMDIEVSLGGDTGGLVSARRTAVVRTARKIFDGTVFPRAAAQPLGGRG
ncbi:4-oxalomesaconate tautomerase [Streptomyces spinoverrucosus]|uniref:4-oxalomesaconate tautomerase n=1 Tax=Streptomyces spinoverrucosus TaxID=284043 RepID=UPI0018C3AC2E|nr:4-oxalomesaconate tautomerase [Streptomyces spinoverrucosus]MBG0850896.1 4-oxalomesaconate tautomerase [Streptomyces spinoverrucosus]